MNTDKNIEILRQMVEDSNHIVFFGGAGVSTESNIPDFRSDDGIYQKRNSPTRRKLCSLMNFILNIQNCFLNFYRTMLYPNAKPNAAHLKLAELEYQKKLDAVVTQNIDGLHQMAGSKNVYELHGSVKRNYCEKCRSFYDESIILESEGIPQCPRCGGTVKPDVVLYGEGLDQNVISGAVNAIGNADMLIVGGTSLVVYPAAGLVNYYHGDRLVLINRDVTSYDSKANLIFS